MISQVRLVILTNIELEDSKGSKGSKGKGRYGQEDDFEREREGEGEVEDLEEEKEKVDIFKGFHSIVKDSELGDDSEFGEGSSDLTSYKEAATKGIKDFDQYQKSHPMISQRTPQSTINEWLSTVNKAKSIIEIQSLKESIFDIAGYDILDEEEQDDEVEEGLEDYDPLRSAPMSPSGDEFSGIKVAGDDSEDNKKNIDSESGDYNSGNDYDDDFEF